MPEGSGRRRTVPIQPASFPEHLAPVRTLLRDYAASLGVDLAFQGFEAELATLPGRYAPPAGRLLLALQGGEAVGCAALRPLQGDTCEMKRLYVRPGARGQGLGRRLAEAICDEARAAGYARLCLDTLPGMVEAAAVYAKLGFRPVAAYAFNPVPGAAFLGLDLRRP